ncbi:MAG: hypothetical protein WC346_00335 [Methanogenium sp.]|jgi:hypothetical protein
MIVKVEYRYNGLAIDKAFQDKAHICNGTLIGSGFFPEEKIRDVQFEFELENHAEIFIRWIKANRKALQIIGKVKIEINQN